MNIVRFRESVYVKGRMHDLSNILDLLASELLLSPTREACQRMRSRQLSHHKNLESAVIWSYWVSSGRDELKSLGGSPKVSVSTVAGHKNTSENSWHPTGCREERSSIATFVSC